MRRILSLSVLCLAASVVSACRPDEVVETEAIPTAGVRFINAVPDTGAMDMIFVDIPENSRHWQISFRNTPIMSPTGTNGVPASTFVQYKPAKAGSRQFRIFMNGSTAAVASTIMKDTTVTLEANKLYTALLWGYANPTGPNRPAGAPAMQLRFVEEAVADPGTQVGVRVINATTGALDVRYYLQGSTAPATAQFANVPAMPAAGAIPTHQFTAPGTIWFNVRDAGGAAGIFADRRALIGTAAVLLPPGPFDPIPGTAVAGSAVTGIVFPPSVTGSQAPQGGGSATVPSWTVRAITYVWDRRPPRPAGT